MDSAAAERAINVVKRHLTERRRNSKHNDHHHHHLYDDVQGNNTQQSDLAVLLIAHKLDDIVACDEVWVMDDGRIVDVGTPGDLISGRGSSYPRNTAASMPTSSSTSRETVAVVPTAQTTNVNTLNAAGEVVLPTLTLFQQMWNSRENKG
jgi:ABC-type glutathione transport system ATPase component